MTLIIGNSTCDNVGPTESPHPLGGTLKGPIQEGGCCGSAIAVLSSANNHDVLPPSSARDLQVSNAASK